MDYLDFIGKVHHPLIDVDRHWNVLALDGELVAFLIDDQNVSVLGGVDLNVVKVLLPYPWVLLEYYAVGVGVPGFFEEVTKYGRIFELHPV